MRLPAALLLSLTLFPALPPTAYACETTRAAFSPAPEAGALVARVIGRAKETVHVAAYSFTSPRIAARLIAAHRRGVRVRVLLDARQADPRSRAVAALLAAGIPVRVNGRYEAMHDKYLVIDGRTAQTGSFNYTASAERRNAENVVVVDDPALARQFLEDWQRLWDAGKDLPRPVGR